MKALVILLCVWPFTFFAETNVLKPLVATNSIRSEIHKFLTPLQRIQFTERLAAPNLRPEIQARLRGANLLRRTEVALVMPAPGTNELAAATFENAQWVYTALRHCHISAHLLSEAQFVESPLEQYRAIYICGQSIRHDAVKKLKEWVGNGGVLWTDALGLSRGETNQPLSELRDVLGITNRTLESWTKFERQNGNELKPFLFTGSPPDKKALIVDMGQVEFEIAVGRVLLETKTGKVLARFGDQKPAVIQNQFGKGKVYVCGFWAGLSYSAKIRNSAFHFREDFDPALATAIGRGAFDSGITQAIMPFERLVEAVFLHQDGHRCIALMNWDYERKPGAAEHLVPAEDISIQLIHVGTIHSVRSLVHGNLPVESTPGAESPNNKTVVLPKLEAMDLLLIE